MKLKQTAIEYANTGLSVLPVNSEKRPILDEWTPYQKQIADEKIIISWPWGNAVGLAVLAGQVSKGLEFVDFDYVNVTPDFLEQWTREVETIRPGLVSKLLMEKSPHGAHFVYRCPEATISGNTKLAIRAIEVSGSGDHLYGHKEHNARMQGDKWIILVTHIETRGEGGYCVVYPSTGYKLITGDFLDVPVISPVERETLINTARSLNEYIPNPKIVQHQSIPGNNGTRPGDDYNECGDVRSLLRKHGWTLKKNDGKGREQWVRPGKDKGHSATLTEDGKCFWVFSSNGHPFEIEKPYDPFSVYTILEHDGDFQAAAKALNEQGYGSKPEKRSKASLMGLKDLRHEMNTKIEWLLWDLIPKLLPIILNGREGDGKTTIALQMIKEIFKLIRSGIVIWIASEGFIQDTLDKIRTLGVDESRLLLLRHPDKTFLWNFAQSVNLKIFDETLQEVKRSGVIILAVFIDSIRGITPYDDNDSRIKTPMMALNSIICDKYKASLIYIHHFKKGGVGGPLLDRNTGPTSIASSVRAVYSILPVSKHVRKISMAKSNILGHTPPDYMAAQAGNSIHIYPANEKSETTLIGQAEQWLIDFFSNGSDFLVSDIYADGEKFGFSSDVLKKAKKHLPIDACRPINPGPWHWKCESFLDDAPYSDNPSLWGKTQKRASEKSNEINQGDQRDQNSGGTPKRGAEGTQGTGGPEGQANKSYLPVNNSSDVNKLSSKNRDNPFSIKTIQEKTEVETINYEDIPPEGIAF